jgi:hypothetical protein
MDAGRKPGYRAWRVSCRDSSGLLATAPIRPLFPVLWYPVRFASRLAARGKLMPIRELYAYRLAYFVTH